MQRSRSPVVSAERPHGAVAVDTADGRQPRRRKRPEAARSVLFPVSLLAAVAPIIVAAARAIDRGWIPVTDNALITIRARDVLTDHHPLLGTWSSASGTTGTAFNNPGPLLFDLLALPARLLEGGAGVAVAVTVLNVASVIGIGVFARRRGGDVVGIAALAATAGLTWAMGSEVLYEPWQPHSLLLPFLCFMVLCWSVACGDLVALPLAVVVGSLVLQTHLSYGILVPAIGACAVVGLALELRRRRGDDPRRWPALRRRAARAAAVAGALLAVCWAQTVVEQLTAEGQGNLGRLASGGSIPYSDMVGVRLGPRIVAAVVALPPWWFRPSFSETLPWGAYGGRLPSLGAAYASLALVALALAACAWAARRGQDRPAWWAVVVAAVAFVAAVISAIRAPASGFGIAPHHFRWVWPISAFVALAVVVALVRRLPHLRRPWPAAVLALATVVLAAVNLPSSNQSPTQEEWAIPAVKDLTADLTAVEGAGTLLVRIEERFGDPYGSALLAELQRRDVPFVVDDPVLERQVGASREFTGDNADAQLLLKVGDATLEAPPGARLVGSIEGLGRDEQRERAELEERIADLLVTEGIPFSGTARDRLGGLAPEDRPDTGDTGPGSLLDERRQLIALFRAGFLDLDRAWERRFERYADLTERWDDETASVFLLAVDEGTSGAAREP